MTTSHSDDLAEKVSAILKHRKRISGGHCATYPANIKTELGVPYSELRTVLNRLYKSNSISIHDGQHGKLIKWKGKI